MSNTPHTLDDPVPVTWAKTETTPYAAAPAAAYAAVHAAVPAAVPAATTAPALNPPMWSGRKTAVAAALAIGISAAGAAAAAALVPVGSTQSDQGQFQRGFGPGGPGGRGGQIPGPQQLQQAPGQVAPANPNGSGT
jgi:hypothetical protein